MNTSKPSKRFTAQVMREFQQDARVSEAFSARVGIPTEKVEHWKQQLAEHAAEALKDDCSPGSEPDVPSAPRLDIAVLSPEEIAVLLRGGGIVRD